MAEAEPDRKVFEVDCFCIPAAVEGASWGEIPSSGTTSASSMPSADVRCGGGGGQGALPCRPYLFSCRR